MSAPRSLKKLKEKKLACIFVTSVTIMQRGFCKSCLLVPGCLAHPRICRLSLHTGACTEPTMGQGSERMRSPARARRHPAAAALDRRRAGPTLVPDVNKATTDGLRNPKMQIVLLFSLPSLPLKP